MSAAPAAPERNALLRDLSGRRLGRYEVMIQLASGGMATVYVARAQGVAGFERLVAIKVLHPHLAHDEEFISMFLDEARLAARIRHPNVVPTLDISDTQGDGYFIVMEYIEGDHLGSILREAARAGVQLPCPVVARLLIDALEGLGAAHGLTEDGQPLGIVHRDISPHNVLVGIDGVARITDFGVAKAEVRLSSTRDGQFKGKLSYMAPEQASSGLADQRSDLFSMAIVLWESLTGRRLFRAENNGELLHRLLHDPIAPPSKYAPGAAAFDAVCARALQRKPEDRFQSAEEFAEAIEHAAAQAGGIAGPRTVGKLVRELLGSKFDGLQQRIKQAADTLGKSPLRPGLLPLPEGTSPGSTSSPGQPRIPMPVSMHTPSAVRPIAPDEMTVGAKPSNAVLAATTSSETAAASATRTLPLAAIAGALAAITLIAIAGIVAAIVIGLDRGAPAPSASPALAPAPASPALAPAPASPALAPAPASPARAADPASPAHAPVPAAPARAADPASPALDGPPSTAPGPASPVQGQRAAPSAETTAGDPLGAPAQSRPGPAPDEPRPGGSHRARRHRGGSSAGESPTSHEDDDLIVNPYRR